MFRAYPPHSEKEAASERGGEHGRRRPRSLGGARQRKSENVRNQAMDLNSESEDEALVQHQQPSGRAAVTVLEGGVNSQPRRSGREPPLAPITPLDCWQGRNYPVEGTSSDLQLTFRVESASAPIEPAKRVLKSAFAMCNDNLIALRGDYRDARRILLLRGGQCVAVLVGFVHMSESVLEVPVLGVEVGHRKQGLGTLLVAIAMQLAAQLSLSYFVVSAADEAMKFWLRLGLQKTGLIAQAITALRQSGRLHPSGGCTVLGRRVEADAMLRGALAWLGRAVKQSSPSEGQRPTSEDETTTAEAEAEAVGEVVAVTAAAKVTVKVEPLETAGLSRRGCHSASSSEQEAVVEEAEGLRLHLSSQSSTGYKGVLNSTHGHRFRAMSCSVNLGAFDTVVEAAVAYARAVGPAPYGLAIKRQRRETGQPSNCPTDAEPASAAPSSFAEKLVSIAVLLDVEPSAGAQVVIREANGMMGIDSRGTLPEQLERLVQILS